MRDFLCFIRFFNINFLFFNTGFLGLNVFHLGVSLQLMQYVTIVPQSV